MIQRTGCIYIDYSSKGMRGDTVDFRPRWCGEICYHRVRYRCRSYQRRRVEIWLECMVEKFRGL